MNQQKDDLIKTILSLENEIDDLSKVKNIKKQELQIRRNELLELKGLLRNAE
jgi:hypothetical protein